MRHFNRTNAMLVKLQNISSEVRGLVDDHYSDPDGQLSKEELDALDSVLVSVRDARGIISKGGKDDGQ